MRRSLMIAIALTFSPGVARSAEAVALRPGFYEVRVRLDLPNIEGAAASGVATVCVPAADGSASQGLGALSANNPFVDCPVRHARREGGTLTFDIVCSGGNAAVASATYELAAETFRGRIRMTLGGKNMTMTETQTGRRVGDCPAPARVRRE
jgi:hypothetical protein